MLPFCHIPRVDDPSVRGIFSKFVLEKGITATGFAKKLGVDIDKIHRILREIPVNRDYEIENKIEKEMGVKIF